MSKKVIVDHYTAEAYNIPEDIVAIARRIYQLRNTDEGAFLFFQLEGIIEHTGCDDAILYDLAADFNWNFAWDDAHVRYVRSIVHD